VRTVVLGGSGNFGARICRRLSQESGIEVIAAGRRASGTGSRVTIDLGAPEFEAALRALRPDVVIHCAGPYQGQDYRVVGVALGCGAHYIDLADGREFVAQFAAQNQAAAVRARRVAVSGASTLPALSSAVVDHLLKGLAHIDAIDIVIAPGQHAPRGAATRAGVLSYTGRGFPWWEDGRWRTAYGWQELRRTRFAFGRRWAAACDVPDLALLPVRYPEVRTVTFRAALEVSIQHYGLWTVAALRRMGVPLPLERLIGAFNRAAGWLDRFGSDVGGMRVSVIGSDGSGRARSSTWQLVARSNHGPEIPCMASVLLTSRLARGEPLASGATPCMGMLKLSDFDSEFARWDIRTFIEDGPI
jgi:hypothetical protein